MMKKEVKVKPAHLEIVPVNSVSKIFDKIASAVTRAAGRPGTSIAAFCIVIIWAVTGPIFNFSNSWQLVINTGTTIITFLMVFIIQQSQNKDTLALHLKLNELIASLTNPSNRLIDVEGLTADELEALKKFYTDLSLRSKSEPNLHSSHSIDEELTGELIIKKIKPGNVTSK